MGVANEINNNRFVTLRSDGGFNFNKIGVIKSIAKNANGAAQTKYNFKDFEMPQKVYYCLKQIDNDGRYAFSNAVYLKANPSSTLINQVYPNPVSNQLNLIIYTENNESINVNVTDKIGRLLFTITTLIK